MEIALLYLGITVIKQQFIEPSREEEDWIALQTSLPMICQQVRKKLSGKPSGPGDILLEDRAFYLVLIWHSS
ncbi:hypothetical protein RND71_008011 [Anisodus tanguticus]|uniref:Uncharacterized protein n=1 Tax=Anisodus tanguticus TaxID=243964 RepID=A0AAE1SMM7_9SOLA|nr:hypothetical protein RND71_008011 [Anisodus tanguticus]